MRVLLRSVAVCLFPFAAGYAILYLSSTGNRRLGSCVEYSTATRLLGSYPLNTVAIVQARMGSTRLPGKALLPIGKYPALYHTLVRTRLAVADVVLAIPSTRENDILANMADEWGFAFVRGSETDVLGRFWFALDTFNLGCDMAADEKADTVVRITADCPFVDPDQIREAVNYGRWSGYAANTYPERRVPKGLDVEVFGTRYLWEASRRATLAHDREHVTPWLQRMLVVPHWPRVGRWLDPLWRWTLDTPQDYEFFKAIAARIDCEPPHPTTEELLALLEREPELAKVNT